ncbi:hypothetical protein P691DRAFT_550234 [Macrolepiota fuliginosa MF-IS2]|uniref:Uncharacterized protein n=1 Tax=Macrolepiota fuliginosa MF-IS2 TaxID=1400762 RepID=A0A9P5XDQ7_9AGAR|nr:hypothetical protein P691DRAFT_550234 [Macrolepiota fuliginosa MF-IS2]
MVLSAFIRTLIFTGVAIVGILIGLFSCTIKSDDVAWSLILPLLPIIAAVVYGIHMDVIRCAMFWRKVQGPAEEDERTPDPPASGEDEEATFTDLQAKYGASGGVLDTRNPEDATVRNDTR